MAQRKKVKEEKKETYYQRWMKGKRRMTLIMKEEEFEAIKKFCDENRMSYREFFTQVAPKLLIENQQLRSMLNDVSAKYNDLVVKHNELVQKYRTLKKEHENLEGEKDRLMSEYEEALAKVSTLTGELTRVKGELESTRKALTEKEGQLKKAEEELSELREVVSVLTRLSKVEVPVEYCGQLKKFGFDIKKRLTREVCSNY